MSDKGILKTSDSFNKNIKLTKTDLEVLEKHVYFFPPDLLYKERKSTSNYNDQIKSSISHINLRQNNQQATPQLPIPPPTLIKTPLPPPNKMYNNVYTRPMSAQNIMGIRQRGMGMRFT